MLLVDMKTKDKSIIIRNIDCSGISRQRLFDLGLHKGASLALKGFAPLGDPIIVRVGDSDVAIRKNDAKHIEIEVS